MTRIEKALKIVSDLHDFYRRIPKVYRQSTTREEKRNQALRQSALEREAGSARDLSDDRR